MPYHITDPNRDHNFDTHPHVVAVLGGFVAFPDFTPEGSALRGCAASYPRHMAYVGIMWVSKAGSILVYGLL